jgi:hypothetical protein
VGVAAVTVSSVAAGVAEGEVVTLVFELVAQPASAANSRQFHNKGSLAFNRIERKLLFFMVSQGLLVLSTRVDK